MDMDKENTMVTETKNQVADATTPAEKVQEETAKKVLEEKLAENASQIELLAAENYLKNAIESINQVVAAWQNGLAQIEKIRQERTEKIEEKVASVKNYQAEAQNLDRSETEKQRRGQTCLRRTSSGTMRRQCRHFTKMVISGSSPN